MKTAALFLGLAVSLFISSAAPALSRLSEITPDLLKASGFTFEILHEELADEDVKFRVVITEDISTFSNHASMALSSVKITDHSQTISPERQLSSERKDRSIRCEFSVAKASLQDPDVRVVFTNPAKPVMVEGKEFYPPSATFVYARLRNFAPPSITTASPQHDLALLFPAGSAATELEKPPQNIFEHLQWCAKAPDAEARLARFEGFWSRYYTPGDYEDAVHIRNVRLCAYRLAGLYAEIGNAKRCREMLQWLESDDEAFK